MDTPEITLSPTPPQQGGKVTVCYSGPKPAKLELDWDPPGTPTEITIPVGADCVEVDVPKDATSLVVTDPYGWAQAASTPIA